MYNSDLCKSENFDKKLEQVSTVDYRKNTEQSKSLNTMPAYSMIEIGIAMIMISILSISFAYVKYHYQQRAMRELTHTRQVVVMQALGQYVSMNSCLPYPCEVANYHAGVQQMPMSQDMQSTVHSVGYIPWKTLGIEQELTLDGYGQPILYVMNPLLGKPGDQKFKPFPDTFLQTMTDMKDKYSFFLMNNNQTLDVISEEGKDYSSFIRLMYFDESRVEENDCKGLHESGLYGERDSRESGKDSAGNVVCSGNTDIKDVYLFENVIEHDQEVVHHNNEQAILSRASLPDIYYYLEGLYKSKNLDIVLVKIKGLDRIENDFTPVQYDRKLGIESRKLYIFYRYRQNVRKYSIKNCIACVLVAQSPEHRELLSKGNANPLYDHEQKITINLSYCDGSDNDVEKVKVKKNSSDMRNRACGDRMQVLYSTRFDMHFHHGPYFYQTYINKVQARLNILAAYHNVVNPAEEVLKYKHGLNRSSSTRMYYNTNYSNREVSEYNYYSEQYGVSKSFRGIYLLEMLEDRISRVGIGTLVKDGMNGYVRVYSSLKEAEEDMKGYFYIQALDKNAEILWNKICDGVVGKSVSAIGDGNANNTDTDDTKEKRLEKQKKNNQALDDAFAALYKRRVTGSFMKK